MSDQPKQKADVFVRTSDSEGVFGSLSDYIAQHIAKQATSVNEDVDLETVVSAKDSQPTSESLFQQKQASVDDSGPEADGLVLHEMDSELSGKHLEKYLPTPAIRLHLTRQRLEAELTELKAELQHYKVFSGKAYAQKVVALKKRIRTIKEKITQVNAEISEINPFQQLFGSVDEQKENPFETPQNPIANWKVVLNPQHKVVQEAAGVNQQLLMMQRVLENHLHDPAFTPEQWSQLMNHYDMGLKKAEALLDEYQDQQSLSEKLSTSLYAWYRQLYEPKRMP